MNDRHVMDELSAFIDGDVRDPERIARHLQTCEICAHRHLQLMKLSAHLRAVPQPEVPPEFLTRVMAHVTEIGPVRPRARFAPLWPRLTLALGALAILLSAGHLWFSPTAVNTPPSLAASNSEDQAPLLTDLPDPSPMEEPGEDLLQDVTYDELMAVLAENAPEWTEDAALDSGQNLEDELDTLDPQDEALFQEVLSEYLVQLREG